MKPELTIIQKIIYYSKCILTLKISFQILNSFDTTISRIPTPFYKIKDAEKEIKEDISRRIEEYENKIRFLLQPLFLGIDFGYDKHWYLCAEDMQQGYLLLEKSIEDLSNKEAELYILSLSNYKDDKFNIKEGELLPIEKVSKVLDKFKDLQGNTPKVIDYMNSDITRVSLIKKYQSKKRI